MSVGDWLGLDETLRGPWSEDRPRVVDDDELAEALGTRPPGLRGRLERSHYLERQPDGLWLIRSPALLDLALQLQDAGDRRRADSSGDGSTSPAPRSSGRRLDRAVRLGAGAPDSAGGPQQRNWPSRSHALRPIAREAAGIILAHEVERGLQGLLQAGPTFVRRRSQRSNTRRRR